MMKALIATAAAGLLMTAAQEPGLAQDQSSAMRPMGKHAGTMSAEMFVQKAGVANMLEIESSKIALERSRNPEVRDFAQRMVADHTRAAADLDGLLDQSGGPITPPQELDADARQQLEALKASTGSGFDRDYVRLQTKAHEQAVELFSAYAEHGENAALRQFAERTLPTLQSHHEAVQRLAQDVGVG